MGSIIHGLATAAVIAIGIPPPCRAGAGRPTPASGKCRKRAESGPTGVASRRTGVRALAAIRLRVQGTLHRPERPYAKRSISACASAISGIEADSVKPSRAGARTVRASAQRPVAWRSLASESAARSTNVGAACGVRWKQRFAKLLPPRLHSSSQNMIAIGRRSAESSCGAEARAAGASRLRADRASCAPRSAIALTDACGRREGRGVLRGLLR